MKTRLVAFAVANPGRLDQSSTADAIEYLLTENRIFTEKLGKKQILLNDDQRRRLALKGKILGRNEFLSGLDTVSLPLLPFPKGFPPAFLNRKAYRLYGTSLPSASTDSSTLTAPGPINFSRSRRS